MDQDFGGGWIGFSPDDENVAPEIREDALRELRRKPVATVTFELLSDEPGDHRAGFEVDPNGPFGGVERTPEERRAAFLKISELVEAEVKRWLAIYRGGTE
jgi:FKBP-type peptidyl-prolyl cis-trans isomerase (trigger factor)